MTKISRSLCAFALSAGLASGFSGCASSAVQTESLLQNPPVELPVRAETAPVPFVAQSEAYCGPATLTMVLRHYGRDTDMNTVAPLVFTPGQKGSLQSDMTGAARRLGMTAVPVRGLPALLGEIAAGNPVIIFENLALDWWPQWHYAVVYGYDLQKPEVYLHSGPDAGKRWNMKKFERSWMLGDYWALVVLPPDRLAATADELAHAGSASALEEIGKISEAAAAYQAMLRQWPRSLPALVGLGNISYLRHEYAESAAYLRRAVEFHPDSASARHNLSVAEAKLKSR